MTVLRLPSWRVIAFTVFAGGLMVWAQFSGAVRFLATDPATHAQRDGVVERQAPLIAGLQRYRDDHGYYPTRLDRLVPHYVQTLPGRKAYLYRGIDSIVVPSAECAREARELDGLVMMPTRELAARRERWAAACVTGHRQFTLQSPDFQAATKGNLERWVQYQSQTGQWVYGWCEHSLSGPTRSRFGHNGACRW
jgi:hypothetical protein